MARRAEIPFLSSETSIGLKQLRPVSGGLIPGWVEALKLMKTGDTWEIVVPADLGYGADGAGDAIPPSQTLVFTMALAKVEYAP